MSGPAIVNDEKFILGKNAFDIIAVFWIAMTMAIRSRWFCLAAFVSSDAFPSGMLCENATPLYPAAVARGNGRSCDQLLWDRTCFARRTASVLEGVGSGT